jgi:putative acetyltransferase
LEIRLFQKEDSIQIAQLFHQTVREVNSKDYSTVQVEAWAPEQLNFRNWEQICSSRFTYVAVDRGMILGFAELEPDGHIDCCYCHKNHQRQGIGKSLYRSIEAKAIALNLQLLFVEASITAKPFFQALGFELIKQQEVICRGQVFINFVMEKSI